MTDNEREAELEKIYNGLLAVIEQANKSEIGWQEIGELFTLCIGEEFGHDEMIAASEGASL